MYDIYNKLPYNNLFKINDEIITDNIKEITNCEYMLIHIRYGDKLHYLSKIINKPNIDISTLLNDKTINNNIDQFLLYTQHMQCCFRNQPRVLLSKLANCLILHD